MAKTSLKARDHRPARFSSYAYTRYERCGCPHSIYCKFGLCRIRLKDLAHKGQISGFKKVSW